MTQLAERLSEVRARMADAAAQAGRDVADIRLLAVTKTHSIDVISQALQLGLRDFGENRVQELQEKHYALADSQARWALIGHLQTNKVARAVELIDEFQALDSTRLAAALERKCAELGRRLPVLIEVNTSGEQSKAGIAPDQVVDFATQLAQYPHLEPRGLMTVAAPGRDEAEACFVRLAALRTQLADQRVLGVDWPELSMGMSGDFELAIKHGATCVRIGTALFGQRG